MTRETLLGLDLGTSGIKAVLFDVITGTPVASATVGYPLSHPHPGWAEQDPIQWWDATIEAIRSCLERAQKEGASAESVRGLALSGQMHGAVLLDEHDQPVRPCIIWADTRCQAECDQITATIGLDRLIDRVSNPALPGFTASKLLWVRNHEPEVWAKVRRVLLPKDYIRYQLTGEAAIDVSDAAGTCLLDVIHGTWATDIMQLQGLDPALIPPVVGAAAIAGNLRADVASSTGLPASIPVAGGGADNACGAVGAGIVNPGQALVSIGTSGVVLAYSATPQVDRSGPIPRAHTFNHAVPNAWYLMSVTQGAGLSLRWVRDQIGAVEAQQAQVTGEDVYNLISASAATVPPGSNGLLFLPYMQGERTPILDAEARGGWIGLTARHTRAHLYRAVLEGVAFSLRDCLEVIRAAGVKITDLRATGGGARSAVWRDIITGILGQPLVPLRTDEGPALGAALLAGVAAGVYPSVPAACQQVVQTGDPVHPDPAIVERYAQLYVQYHDLYPALKESMHGLAAFEGAQ
jgi:xylulokinase